MADRKPLGKKEGAWGVDQNLQKGERVLGKPEVGKGAKKQEVL
jgi:hypothetical protein